MTMEMEVIRDELQLGFPYWNPIRRRFDPESPFFAAGNVERELLAKQECPICLTSCDSNLPNVFALDWTEEEKKQLRHLEDQEASMIYCPVAGCRAQLTSLDMFEDHYTSRHSASCTVCSRVYPTSRLLSIHVSEVHDSFFQAKVARGFAMYECLVEGCGVKLKSYKSRQQHLVDKHKFPAAFEFFRKVHPSKKRRQKDLRKKAPRKIDAASSAMQIEEDTMDELVSSVSKLSTSDSPASVSFGRRNSRGLAFVPRAVRQEKKPEPPVRMKS